MLAAAGNLGWARLFAMTSEGPRVAHVAMLVDVARRALRFHLAKSNAIMAALDQGPVLALFEGPHAYVSASWYRAPKDNVPTWNYVAIECTGRAVALAADALVVQLDDLARLNEKAVGGDWSVATMDRRRFDAMLPAITAFELPIETVRGTRKISQNKPQADVDALAAWLERSGAGELAALMRAGA